MNRYGQLIYWSAQSAPHPFSCELASYSYNDGRSEQLITDQVGDNMALVLHSAQAALQFEGTVTSSSTDFLDLSAGAGLVVSTLTGGVVIASRAVEKWVLEQKKTISVSATHFPDIVQASPVLAGTNLNAFLPSQSALTIVSPGNKIIYGTFGLGHASGIVHGLTIEQQLTIRADKPSPDGKILGAVSYGYMRKITLELLAKTDLSAKPATNTILALTGAPAHAGGYKIVSVNDMFKEEDGRMYSIEATWIPPFAA